MTKFRAAEWILAQVLPPDRASSTVGDWMEDASERGNIWFWSCVFRTAIAGLWSDIAHNPLTTARICILEFGRSVLIPIGLNIAVHTVATPTDRTIYALTSWWYIATIRWISRRFSNRALAGCFTVSFIGWAVVYPWVPYLPAGTVHDINTNIFSLCIVIDLFGLAPTIWKRRHHPARVA